jgi:hypothetical protein
MPSRLDLLLPEPERRRAAALRGGLADFLYVPGPALTSPLDPGLYRSSFIFVMADGQAVRASSFNIPAFGRELCRLRFEPVQNYRRESLGSFFEPSRRGLIYALTGEGKGLDARPPEEPGWSYAGPALGPRLGALGQVRLLRERVSATLDGERVGWTADRGLVLTDVKGQESLLLAEAGSTDNAAFLPSVGIYRLLLDPSAPAAPGASALELLGYGDSRPDAVSVMVQPL